MTSIPKIAITGGPCAGKTTGMKFLVKQFAKLGYHPLVIPEAPTLLMLGGITPNKFPTALFQAHVIEHIIEMERRWERAAQELVEMRGEKPILLCDRGIMDALAYTPEGVFLQILRNNGLTPASVFARYAAVFHLRTAALGAEDHYSLENNPARLERTPAEARRTDQLTLDAWIGHPHLRVVSNEYESFDDKLKRLFLESVHTVGHPVPLEIERRFIVKKRPGARLPSHRRIADIEQRYLAPQNANERPARIRARTIWGDTIYTHTVKEQIAPGIRVERERPMKELEYAHLSKRQLPGTIAVRKRREYFVWREQYFELDTFTGPHKGLQLLELELLDVDGEIQFPPFLDIIGEVTEDRRYSNAALAGVKTGGTKPDKAKKRK